MRILLLTDCYLPHAGGARVYYHNLYRELVRDADNHVTILTSKVPGWQDFDRIESGERLRIVRIGSPLRNWKYHQYPKIIPPLLRGVSLLAGGKFDLIHFGDLYPQGVLSLWFKRVFGKPYVAYSHGEEITQTDLRRYQPRVRNAIFRGADIVVAANELARQNLLRIGIPGDRIRKINPGVDCCRFQPKEPPRDLIERHGLVGKRVILTVGRLVPRKGHRMVLEALRKLLPVMPELVYVIVGTGSEQEALRNIATDWNLTGSVRFAGYVKDADLPAYYNACDLYVMPNSEDKGDLEGFGMVFTEANACGKAVVGGRSGGAAEAVIHGTTGVLVDPQNPDELADVLRSLLLDPTLRTRMGEQGMMRARSEFSWGSRARALDEVSREIIARKCPAALGREERVL
jgi:phosphatidylinositol alpha-1,6-mannosyltransferase